MSNAGALPEAAPRELPRGGSRIGWVDYAKGICMIGVVTLYAVNKMKLTGGSGWLQVWADFAQPFRMPDFFLLSGLFLHRVLDRPWRDYLDKKVLHYLYFFVLWTVIFYAARMAALQVGLFRGEEDAGSLLYKLVEPFAMLWFIQLLPVFFLVTRLLHRAPAWVILPLAAALQMFPPQAIHPTLLTHFCERFVYFYVGYRFAARFFDLAAWAQSERGRATALVLGWIVLNGGLVFLGCSGWRGISLGLGLLGAMGVITTGALLMPARGTAWLRYLGQHSLVIYLGFYLPMLVLLALARRAGALLDPGTLGLAVSALSALCALSLFWATRRSRLAFLFARPAWVGLTRRPRAEVPPLGAPEVSAPGP